MTLLKDNNYKDINVALLSLEADIKNKTGFDTSAIDKQLAEINSRIDKINAGDNNSSAQINDIRYEIEDINSKANGNSVRIENIEQKLTDIFSAENKVTDFNTTTTSGIYYWVTDAANRPIDYGVLLVNKYDGGSSTSIWVNQVAYGTNNKIYFRHNINNGGWTEWQQLATSADVADKQDFRIFNSLEEFNEKKDTSLTVVSGIDNMKDIANAMSNGEILIILVRYVLGSEVYFGLTSDTGWTKMFTFIKSNGLCDVECRTTYPLTLKRVLNLDGVVGDWQQVATMDKVAQCVENKTPNAKTVSFELNSASWNCGTIYGNTNNGGNFKYDYYVTLNNTVGLVKQDGYGQQGSITASLSGTTLTLTASENTTIKTVTVIKT